MSLGPGYFDDLYAGSPDPWRLATRWYEQRKYALTLAALPSPRYRSAFEPGCSVGVLSHLLAERCDRLLACDVSAVAVRATAERMRDRCQVRVERRVLPADWPAEVFDLVVLSEVLYYFDDDDLQRIVDLAVAALEPGGTLVTAHWRHPVADYPQSGDRVHRVIAGCRDLVRLVEHREEDFLLDVYLRPAPGTDPARSSVAAREGLV